MFYQKNNIVTADFNESQTQTGPWGHGTMGVNERPARPPKKKQRQTGDGGKVVMGRGTGSFIIKTRPEKKGRNIQK